MKLFAELYLDEDVSVLLSKLLKARGFAALTALWNYNCKAKKCVQFNDSNITPAE